MKEFPRHGAERELRNQLELYRTINQSGCRPLLRQSQWFKALLKAQSVSGGDYHGVPYYVLRTCPGEWAPNAAEAAVVDERRPKRARYSKRVVRRQYRK